MGAHRRANLFCVLKVDPSCGACKRQIMEVLSSIDGVYDISIDSETKTVRIAGEVDPQYCIIALARCGIHAELINANISNHPRIYDRNYIRHEYYDDHINNYYGGYGRGCRSFGRSLPEGMWHEGSLQPYYMRNIPPEYPYNSNYYYGGYDGGCRSFGRSLPEGMWHEGSLQPYYMRNMPPEYSYNSNYYYDQGVRSYVPYFHDEPLNLCSIL